MVEQPGEETTELPVSSRKAAAGAGWAATERQSEESATALETESTRRVESQRFSWLSRKVVIESRNDQFIKGVYDVVLDERPRWIAAQRAAGVQPDFIIDRRDVEEFACLVLGDPGEGDRSQHAVAEALPTGEEDSDFMVVMSDVIYPTGDVNEYREKFYEMYEGYPKPIYALPGNHDWYDGLDGFMWHFCGAEPLARVSHRLSSFPIREWLVRVLWRKSSRPERRLLLSDRDQRWSKTGGRPPQPGPYWLMDTKHLALVAIDTGVKGTLDHDQGHWLCRVSREIDKPKVLLTGKPLYVSGRYLPCRIEWAEDTTERRRYPTVDDVVRDPEMGYVAAIGGDVHNYQRYAIPVHEAGRDGDEVERTVQYIVSGGAGAYMSQTHAIDRVDRLQGPEPADQLDEETNLRLFPLRGDSLTFYAGELLFRAPRLLFSSLLWLTAATALAVLLIGGGWALNDMTWLTGVVAATQLASAVIASPQRRARLFLHAIGYALLTAGVALFASAGDEWGRAFSIPLLAISVLALPALILAAFGQAARGFAAGSCLLLGLTLLTYLVEDGAFQEIVRVAAIFALSLIGLGLFVFAARLARGLLSRDAGASQEARATGLAARQRARPSKESSPGLTVAGVLALVLILAWLIALATPANYLIVSGVAMFVLAAIPLLHALWLGAVQLGLSFDLRRRFRGPHEDVADQASKYMAERLGVLPVRAQAGAVQSVEKGLRRLFDLTYPRSKLKRTAPFHHFLSEILDRDEPPLFKNYLELEVRKRAWPVRRAELHIRCYAVSGVPVGRRTLEDDGLDVAPIPL